MLAPSRAGRRLHDSSHRWQPATILVHHNSGKTTICAKWFVFGLDCVTLLPLRSALPDAVYKVLVCWFAYDKRREHSTTEGYTGQGANGG